MKLHSSYSSSQMFSHVQVHAYVMVNVDLELNNLIMTVLEFYNKSISLKKLLISNKYLKIKLKTLRMVKILN